MSNLVNSIQVRYAWRPWHQELYEAEPGIWRTQDGMGEIRLCDSGLWQVSAEPFELWESMIATRQEAEARLLIMYAKAVEVRMAEGYRQ